MGTWGPGNFDSDTAADHLSILASKLVTDIATAMSGDLVGLEPDEWDGTTVPCNVELLTLIAKQRWVGVTLPAPDAVAAWSTTFVGVWDASIDDLGPSPTWKHARREVLVRTFAELELLCAREAASRAEQPAVKVTPAAKRSSKAAAKRSSKASAKSSSAGAARSSSKAAARSSSSAAAPAKSKGSTQGRYAPKRGRRK